MNRYRKAVAAVVVPVVVWLAAKYGLELPVGWPEALTIVLTGGSVYAIPNDSRPPLDVRHPAGRDRGAVDGILIVLVVFALAIGYLWATR